MGILAKLFHKPDISQKEDVNQEEDFRQKEFYKNAEMLEPFSLFENEQMRSFIAELSKKEGLTESVKAVFKRLWDVACIDIDGFGNNIWNLKKGQFEVYNKDGIKIQFSKTSSADIDVNYDQGRADFKVIFPEGELVIHQHRVNRSMFLIYVSDDISPELLQAFREAEADALDIKQRTDRPTTTRETLQEKYKIEVKPVEMQKGIEGKSITPDEDQR